MTYGYVHFILFIFCTNGSIFKFVFYQPTGRAIQVEGGYGERLPSIDTRPPRMRDSDAIIEVRC